jgi:hypothetical protein
MIILFIAINDLRKEAFIEHFFREKCFEGVRTKLPDWEKCCQGLATFLPKNKLGPKVTPAPPPAPTTTEKSTNGTVGPRQEDEKKENCLNNTFQK